VGLVHQDRWIRQWTACTPWHIIAVAGRCLSRPPGYPVVSAPVLAPCVYVQQSSTFALSSRLLQRSKRCSSAACKTAAGVAAAAPLLNIHGIFGLPDHAVSAVRCDVALHVHSGVSLFNTSSCCSATSTARDLGFQTPHRAHAVWLHLDNLISMHGCTFGCTACANQTRLTALERVSPCSAITSATPQRR
jgi:hypothetical protein